MDLRSSLGDPAALAHARAIAHAAVQPLAKAARANLPRAADDSHSNLGWSAEAGMFLTHRLGTDPSACRIGLELAPLCLTVRREGHPAEALPLAGKTLAAAESWLDQRLEAIGLNPASPVRLPYTLPPAAAGLAAFGPDDPNLKLLGAWYALAVTCLTDFAAAHKALDPGPSAVRCWPHHFDIATYVGLGEGGKGIGVGLSPGDESYDQPYFYVNPWPHLDPSALPPPIAPGHWHTTGFVGAVATGAEILSADDPQSATLRFLSQSFEAGRKAAGL